MVKSLQPVVGERIKKLIAGEHRPPGPSDIDDVNQLSGHAITRVIRRGKWIVIELGSESLVVHLRMTGSLLLRTARSDPPSHHRWTLQLSQHELTLVDPRSFGTIAVHNTDSLQPFFAKRLGREPIDDAFDGEYLRSKCAHRHVPIKTLLLDQKVAAGAGNIYVDEALFTAGVDPHEIASSLKAGDYERIAAALVAAVQGGIERGGSSVRNYMHADGTEGTNQHYLNVYSRRGEPCNVCGSILSYDKIGGRGTVWCKVCQPQKAT